MREPTDETSADAVEQHQKPPRSRPPWSIQRPRWRPMPRIGSNSCRKSSRMTATSIGNNQSVFAGVPRWETSLTVGDSGCEGGNGVGRR